MNYLKFSGKQIMHFIQYYLFISYLKHITYLLKNLENNIKFQNSLGLSTIS